MPNFLFRCAKVAARTFARGSAAFRAAGASAVVVLSLSLAACGGDASGNGGAEKPVVLTTFTVLADVARNVAGDKLTVESITKAGAEIHGYEPTPGDIRKASKADLILDNGLNLEAWFAQFVEGLDVPHAVVSEGVQVMSISEDSYQGKPNPHAWMSPVNVQIYVDNMVKAFSELDPENADVFKANGDAYKAQLQSVQDEMKTSLAGVPENQRALVTCEGAFSYLARDAGLREVYIWAVNAEQQATPQQITRAIEYVKANQVPAVFCESTVSDAPMKQVVGATGTKFGGTLYVDSLSEADGPVPTYLDLIRHDAGLITKALAGAPAGASTGAKP
ncbi:MAG TPA: metal ABC transporter substrate-binding protein [Arthrobacter sp.]|nr:metal ABC transporter substrate-binding protein [Arthrobacter sp.]